MIDYYYITEESWSEVSDCRDASGGNPFKDIATFAISLLILPNTNAEVERLFSSLNIIKNKLRNKMLLPMLSVIFTVKYGMKRHNKCCKNFELPNAVIKKLGQWNLTTLKSSEEEVSAFSSYDEVLLEIQFKKCLVSKTLFGIFLGAHKIILAFFGIFFFQNLALLRDLYLATLPL